MATFNVTNSNNSGTGSLRDAIALANSTPGLDTINLSSNVTLNTGINITDSLILTGTNSVITQTGSDRLFKIDDSTINLINVTFNNLTLTGGKPVETGGAVYTVENLTLNNVIVENNTAARRGGGVYSEGATLVVNDSVFRNNVILEGTTSSSGAAILNTNGVLIVDDSIIENNSSRIGVIASSGGRNTITDTQIVNNDGGGIFIINKSELAVNNTQIIDNTVNIVNGVGGGIGVAQDSQVTISNSTISGNQATYGGGILVGDTGSTGTIVNTKITNNIATKAGGGVDVADYASVTIKDSLISGNTAPIGSALETFENSSALLTNVDIVNNTGSENQLEGDDITIRTSNVNNKGLQLGHIHRFYQQEKGFHLYTSDVNEVSTIKGKSLTGELKYRYESEKFSVLTSNKDITGTAITGAEEVYRFFNRGKTSEAVTRGNLA